MGSERLISITVLRRGDTNTIGPFIERRGDSIKFMLLRGNTSRFFISRRTFAEIKKKISRGYIFFSRFIKREHKIVLYYKN